MYTRIHIYTYTRIHIYTCIHICIYTYRNLLKSCPVCLIACKPSGKGFLEVVPFKPLHGDSPHPTYRPKDLDVLCLAAFRWCLCCGGWRTQTFKRCVVLAFRWCFTGSQRPLDASTLECERRCFEYPASTWGLTFGQDGAVSV